MERNRVEQDIEERRWHEGMEQGIEEGIGDER